MQSQAHSRGQRHRPKRKREKEVVQEGEDETGEEARNSEDFFEEPTIEEGVILVFASVVAYLIFYIVSVHYN